MLLMGEPGLNKLRKMFEEGMGSGYEKIKARKKVQRHIGIRMERLRE